MWVKRDNKIINTAKCTAIDCEGNGVYFHYNSTYKPREVLYFKSPEDAQRAFQYISDGLDGKWSFCELRGYAKPE